MTSMILGNTSAAEQSSSQSRLNGTGNRKRPLYSNPTKAVHLSDGPYRKSRDRLDHQFGQTARSYTPPPGVDSSNWVEQNKVLFSLDGTNDAERTRSNNRNKKGSTVQEPTLRAVVAHGGVDSIKAMFGHLASTGMFDDEVQARHNQLSNGTATNASISIIESGEDLLTQLEEQKKKSAGASKKKSFEEIANNPDVGADVAEANSWSDIED